MTELDKQLKIYRTMLQSYTHAVERVSADSIAAAGKDAGPQRYWASVVMTRLVAVASGVLFICPDSVLNPDGLLWDFGNVAAPIRSVFETVLMLFYLGIETVSEDEWKLRINLIHLHDCIERIRLFHGFDTQEQLAALMPTAVNLRNKISLNPAFIALPLKTQKTILNGDKPTLFGKSEIIRRMGHDPDAALNYYRFISNYIHNFPFGFHRSAMQGRDGTINAVDVGYSAEALRWGTVLLGLAADAFEKELQGFAEFGKEKFDVRILRRSALLSARDEALIKKAFKTV